ncbi:MAG: TIM barrel protein [Eubacteriales bacterium]
MFCFGPSGKPENFYQKYKDSNSIPQWLHDHDLDAFEFPFTKSLNIGQEKAENIGESAKDLNIKMSIHAPYAIDLIHPQQEIRNKSIKDLFRAMLIASWLGADRVVFHPGRKTEERNIADVDRLKESMEIIMDHYFKFNFSGIYLCPEVMGKTHQMGSIDEILSICNIAEEVMPTLDFAHIHGRYNGLLKKEEDFKKVLELIKNHITKEKLNKLHIHFTKVEYGVKGEKRHRAYGEEEFGPDFCHLAKLLVKNNLSGRVISESRETMLEDAITLKTIYMKELNKVMEE